MHVESIFKGAHFGDYSNLNGLRSVNLEALIEKFWSGAPSTGKMELSSPTGPEYLSSWIIMTRGVVALWGDPCGQLPLGHPKG